MLQEGKVLLQLISKIINYFTIFATHKLNYSK